MPNSRVRPLTEKAKTPATPTTEISSASAANPPKTMALRRVGESTLPPTASKKAGGARGVSGAVAIAVAEVAALDDGNTQGIEIACGNRAECRAGVVFGIFLLGTFCSESEGDGLQAGIAPGNAETVRDTLDSGKRAEVALEVAIEILDLFRGAAVSHHGQVHGENVRGVKGGLGFLEFQESFH